MRTISTQVPTDPMGYVSFASRILISLAEGLCVQQHHITSGVGITIRQRLINFVRMPRQHKLTLLYSLFVIVDRVSNTEALTVVKYISVQCQAYANICAHQTNYLKEKDTKAKRWNYWIFLAMAASTSGYDAEWLAVRNDSLQVYAIRIYLLISRIKI